MFHLKNFPVGSGLGLSDEKMEIKSMSGNPEKPISVLLGELETIVRNRVDISWDFDTHERLPFWGVSFMTTYSPAVWGSIFSEIEEVFEELRSEHRLHSWIDVDVCEINYSVSKIHIMILGVGVTPFDSIENLIILLQERLSDIGNVKPCFGNPFDGVFVECSGEFMDCTNRIRRKIDGMRFRLEQRPICRGEWTFLVILLHPNPQDDYLTT